MKVSVFSPSLLTKYHNNFTYIYIINAVADSNRISSLKTCKACLPSSKLLQNFIPVFPGTTERSELDVVIEKDINIGIKMEHFHISVEKQ